MERFFSNPPFAWMALGLLLLPLLVHLLNRRRHREVRWAAMHFLLAANRRSVRRMRLEQWLLLALRTAALVLLPLAMARPLLHSTLAAGLVAGDRHQVIILDPSLSMSAVHGASGTSVFQRQLQRAGELIDALADGDRVTLITAGLPAQRLNRQPLDPRRAHQLLGSVAQAETRNDLVAALQLVQEVLDEEQNEHHELCLDVLSDLTPGFLERMPLLPGTTPGPAVAELMRSIAARCPVTLYALGNADLDNLAVHDLALSSALVGTSRLTHVHATVHNHSSARAPEVTLELLVDTRPSVELRVPALLPQASHTVQSVVEFNAAGLHALEARLADHGVADHGVADHAGDALPADDQRRLVVEARDSIPVLLVDGKPGARALEGQTSYLATALAPRTQRVRQTFIEPAIISESEMEGVQLERYEVLVLCNVRRMSTDLWKRLERFVGGGHGLIMFLGDLVDVPHYNEEASALLPAPLGQAAFAGHTEEEFVRLDPTAVEPALASVFGGRTTSGLFQARIHQYLRWAEGAELPAGVPLLTYDNGDVAVAERSIGMGRCIVCTTTASMDWTNLPAKGDFVTLCMSLLRRAAPPNVPDRNATAGARLVVRAEDISGAAATAARLRSPSARVLAPEVRLMASGFELDFGHLPTSGWYALESTRDEGPVAVNVDPLESAVHPLNAAALRALLDCDFKLVDAPADTGNIAAPATGRTSGGLLLAVLVLLLSESAAALAFGHQRR